MIFGAIIGDVVGSPYEFHNIKTKSFPLVTEKSHFTDDSVMTVAVASALMKFTRGKEIDEAEFEREVLESMRSFGRLYPLIGYGWNFKTWLFSDDPKPYNSWGNGAAMRVSPVGWWFDDLQAVERFAAVTARVTHNHPEGIKGAQATAAAVFLSRTGNSKDDIRSCITERYGYDLSRMCDEIRPDYSFDVSCQGTVPEAIIAFLEAEDFEDAVRNAVSLGGDSDTLTAITASIAHGMWGIPGSIEEQVRSCLDDFMMGKLSRWELSLSGKGKVETAAH